jgi:phospho-N-acetylmuramoyl-pentapeptide-transferase
MFNFTEVVALQAGLLALVLSVLFTRLVLGLVRRWQLGQQVREDGPASHKVKQGTPSLGGTAILTATVFASGGCLFWLSRHVNSSIASDPYWHLARQANQLTHLFLLLFLLVVLPFGLLGLADDLSKMLAGNTRGIPARYRIVLEILFAGAFAWLAGPPRPSYPKDGLSALASLGLHGPLWFALAVFTIVGSANAVNFTDGVDGLAATLVAICAGVMAAACTFVAPPLALPLAALAGAAAGFLYFNANPAKIFMGDVGSLGLGALLGGIAVAGGLELFFALAGIVFVVEVVSVILQVVYFRSTGGKRLFRMTPIHHAFELRGWKEPQIVARFALVGLLAGGLALVLFLHF